MIERIATLEELNREYSILDLVDANDALDAYQSAMAEAQKPKTAPGTKRGRTDSM